MSIARLSMVKSRIAVFITTLVILSLILAACGGNEELNGAATQEDNNSAAAAATATLEAAPADLKQLPQPVVAEPVGQREPTTVKVDLEAKEVVAKMDEGVAYHYWTFNGTIPGPMVRVRQGDTVELTLKNAADSAAAHSVDLHAVTGPGGAATYTQVKPGSDATISFKALNPGVYVYHCATPPVPMHISNGMYGLIVVEPPEGLPAVDKEFYVMQGDFYLSGDRGEPGTHEFDMNQMLDENPDYVVFNGSVNALSGENALQAEVGDTVRIFVGSGGVNLPSSFHVIGEIFDSVAVEGGSLINHNVQTTTIPAGGATMVEFELQVPGDYVLVDHSLGRAVKGATGILHVDGAENPEIYNPVKPGDAGATH